MKTEAIHVRVTEETKAELRRQAADSCRSLSQHLEYLIKQESRNATSTLRKENACAA